MIEKEATIVVVDDSEEIRESIANWFGGRYQVLVYENGMDAWQDTEEFNALWWADLMVTDLIMPKMDGMTLLKRIKGRYPEIKTIMISGEHYAEEDALKNGADRFIKKPFKLEQLQKTVQELLS